MAFFTIPAVLAFSIILSFIEIPKMLNEKLFRELVAFSFLLVLGTVLAVLRSMNVTIPSPSDLIALFYAPFSNIMKSLLQ